MNGPPTPGAEIIAVVGLAREARIVSGPGVRSLVGGGRTAALGREIRREVERGARAIMSFGLAGGLAEGLTSGTWIVARAIVTPDARWPCDAAWTALLAARLPGAVCGDVAGVDTPVVDAASKRALHLATGAIAVDTESHIAASIATMYGLPFAAFRVVVDSSRRTLPAVALVALTPDGKVSGAAVLGSVARRPTQLPDMLRAAVDAHAAFRALSHARRTLGPGLGYPDLGELVLDV